MDSSPLRGLDIRSIVGFFRNEAEDASVDFYTAVFQSLRQSNLNAIRPFASLLIVRLRKELEIAGAANDLNSLLRFGLKEETVLALILLCQFLPAVDHTLRSLLGGNLDRKRKAKALREAALVMDQIAKVIPNGDGKVPSAFHHAVLAKPSLTSDSLLYFADFLFLREQLLDVLDANSGLEIAKYTFASVVRRTTGKFHDREVSGIMGAILNKDDYDETAHRVWRIRTLRRLDKTCSFIPTLLHALNSALAEQDFTGAPLSGVAEAQHTKMP
jgi:hypothetical protein